MIQRLQAIFEFYSTRLKNFSFWVNWFTIIRYHSLNSIYETTMLLQIPVIQDGNRIFSSYHDYMPIFGLFFPRNNYMQHKKLLHFSITRNISHEIFGMALIIVSYFYEVICYLCILRTGVFKQLIIISDIYLCFNYFLQLNHVDRLNSVKFWHKDRSLSEHCMRIYFMQFCLITKVIPGRE